MGKAPRHDPADGPLTGDPTRNAEIAQEAARRFVAAWKGELGEGLPFQEMESKASAGQMGIAVYLPTGLLTNKDVTAIMPWLDGPLIALAARIRSADMVPATESLTLHLPQGLALAHRATAEGICLRTIAVFHPAPNRAVGLDFGAMVMPHWNIDMDVLEQRWCVLAMRFDVVVRPVSAATDAEPEARTA